MSESEVPQSRSASPDVGGGPAPAEPALVTQAYDLLLWLVKHVEKFPRAHRYTIGEQMQAAGLAVVLSLVEAAYTREKIPILRRTIVELEKLRFLTRLGKDLGFTSLKQYEFASKEIVGLSQQTGGWLRQQQRRG